MRLLLLTQSIPLTLLLLHFLTHAFALRLLRIHALGPLLFDLLPAKFLHLLPRIAITPGRLSCQVGHLSFSGLLCRHVWLLTYGAILLTLLSRPSGALICDLEFLISHSIRERLNAQSPRQISSERLRRWSYAGYHRRTHHALHDRLRHIDSRPRFTSSKRHLSQRINR